MMLLFAPLVVAGCATQAFPKDWICRPLTGAEMWGVGVLLLVVVGLGAWRWWRA